MCRKSYQGNELQDVKTNEDTENALCSLLIIDNNLYSTVSSTWQTNHRNSPEGPPKESKKIVLDTSPRIYYGNARSVFNWDVIVFKMEAYFTAARRGWPLHAALLALFFLLPSSSSRALISNAESGNQAPLKLLRSGIESGKETSWE